MRGTFVSRQTEYPEIELNYANRETFVSESLIQNYPLDIPHTEERETIKTQYNPFEFES